MIENILGFDIVGKDNLINWHIKRTDKHGIKNIPLLNQKISLIFKMHNNKPQIKVNCEKPFSLKIIYKGKEYFYKINKTETTLEPF